MSALEEIMSEDITNSEHTVFYLVHKHMKTMHRIDQPITFERPKYLKKNLVKIQERYEDIVKYIRDFDDDVQKRLVRGHEGREANRQARLEAERRRAERQKDEAQQQQQLAEQGPARVGTVSPPPPKRRRIAPNRLNIAST